MIHNKDDITYTYKKMISIHEDWKRKAIIHDFTFLGIFNDFGDDILYEIDRYFET